jgi:phosphopantetheine--protein transferase-like protein
MIRGIGIDTTTISEMAGIVDRLGEGALARMFTAGELAASHKAYNTAEYLASRFAAKEAVFKAVAHLLKEKYFDMRMVETFNDVDGSPYIKINDHLQDVINRAGVTNLLITITTEGDLATAFVLAE